MIQSIVLKLIAPVVIAFGVLAMSTSAQAQNDHAQVDPLQNPLYRKMLTAPSLVTGGDGETVWTVDGSGVWYRTASSLRMIDPTSGKTRLLLDEKRLRAALASVVGSDAKSAMLPLDTMKLTGPQQLSLRWAGFQGSVDLDSYKVSFPAGVRLVPQGRFLRYLFMYPGFPMDDVTSPNGRTVATIQSDGNLAVRPAGVSAFRALTNDAVPQFGWDIESRRISIGAQRAAPVMAWSPDSTRVFAMRIDRRALPQMPEVRLLHDPSPDVIQHDIFPAGGPYYLYRPAIVDVATGKQTPVKIDFGTDFVLMLNWAEDGRTVYVGRLDRKFGKVQVLAVDAATGSAKTILTETDTSGLRTPHQIYYAGNLGFTLLPGNRGFLWLSERSGWNHIYHYTMAGKLVRQLTRGDWRVENVSEVDVDRGRVYFTGRPDAAHIYDVQVMSVPLAGGKVTQISAGRGTHDQPLFSPDKTRFVDRSESFDVPPRLDLRSSVGQQIATIDAADATALSATGWKPPFEFSVDGPDGNTIRGVMYRPFDFDPARKYPVVEYIYGGPQALWSYPTFIAPGEAVGANMPLAMAQLGYIVIKMDTGGTPGRSRAFQMEVTRKWGPGIAADHAAVIRALAKKYSWVDDSRVGVFGHSWGGLNALFALATQGDLYDAAVVSAPGFGIEAFPDGFMENYLGSPKQNPEAWARVDVMGKLGAIKNPLMLVSGTQDYSIYVTTIRISDALVKRGFQHEIALAPGQAHGIYGPYADYLTEKEVRFFLKNVPVGDVAK